MLRLRIDSLAELEAEQAIAHYEAIDVELAARFLVELRAAFEAIEERPDSFPRLELPATTLTVRQASLWRFPYGVVFLRGDLELRVLAIAHHARRPLYWSQRL